MKRRVPFSPARAGAGMNRRRFIGTAARCTTAAIAAASLPFACRSREPAGACKVQLNWIMDAEYAGTYVALQRGYFAKRGVSPVLVPGGPTISVPTRLVSGDALLGVTSPESVGSAVSHGADLKIIAAMYQKSPFAIVSLRKSPVRVPADLVGKRVGVQASDEVLWRAFLRLNGLPAERIERVVAGTDPTPLVSGEVDAWLSYATNEPIALELRGIETTAFLLHDHGYPMMQQVYATRASNLAQPESREQLVRYLSGDIAGWRDAVRDPDLGAQLAVQQFGRDLDLDLRHQRLLARKQTELVVTDETRRHGLLWMTDRAIDQTIASLSAGGLAAERSLFTRELLETVYEREPSLRGT